MLCYSSWTRLIFWIPFLVFFGIWFFHWWLDLVQCMDWWKHSGFVGLFPANVVLQSRVSTTLLYTECCILWIFLNCCLKHVVLYYSFRELHWNLRAGSKLLGNLLVWSRSKSLKSSLLQIVMRSPLLLAVYVFIWAITYFFSKIKLFKKLCLDILFIQSSRNRNMWKHYRKHNSR